MFARVIRFDKRGMGMSDRVQVGTLEERMDDVRAVMDAAGSSRAAILGTSEGGPLAMMFAASHPERVQALLLVGSEVKERVDDDWPWGEVNAAQFAGALEDLATGWGTVGLPPERYAPSLTGLEAERMYRWTQRLSGSRRVRRGDRVQESGLRHRRPRPVQCRAHSRPGPASSGRPGLPRRDARYLAATLPDVTYRELAGDDHVAWMNPAGGEEIAVETEIPHRNP